MTPQKQDDGSLLSRLDEIQRTHRAVLAQSPLWITGVATVMLTGALHRWNDSEYMFFSVAVASPAVVIPAIWNTRSTDNLSWWRRYWFKLNLWIAIVVFFGTYLGTAYFFDLMGMRYTFDVRWNLSSNVVGQNRQQVPLFMYPLTHAYFMTYFVGLLEAERLLRPRWPSGGAGQSLLVMFLSYALAYTETFFMASPLLSDFFAYASRERMLKLGSLGYASYFVVGLPMARRIDREENWKLQRVVIEALATCMMIMLLLEVWSNVIGPL